MRLRTTLIFTFHLTIFTIVTMAIAADSTTESAPPKLASSEVAEESFTFHFWLFNKRSSYEGRAIEPPPNFFYDDVTNTRNPLLPLTFSLLTGPFKYTGTLPLTIYREETSIDGSGEESTKKIVSGTLQKKPMDAQNLLILGSLTDDSRLDIAAMPAFNLEEELGKIAVYNLTNQKLAFQLNDETNVLSKNATTIIDIPEIASQQRLKLEVAIFEEEGEDWKKIYGRRFRLNPERSAVLLMYEGDDGALVVLPMMNNSEQ